jgi:hypothetical protein
VFKAPSFFGLQMYFSFQGLEKKLQGHELKICQLDFGLCRYSLRAQTEQLQMRLAGHPAPHEGNQLFVKSSLVQSDC